MSDPVIFECVRMYDPEVVGRVDPRAIGDYALHRDMSLLGLPPEAKPVKFRCRVLTRNQRKLVRQQPTDDARYELAFRLGLLSIENLPGVDGSLRSWTASRAKDPDPLDDAALDASGLGDRDIQEIGAVIHEQSFLALGAPLSVPLLASSHRAFGAVLSRIVEQSKGSEIVKAE